MSIQDLGALGEFLGLFLVLATLVYLSLQTRQAKQLAASETARGLVADFIGLWGTITKDAEFADIIRRAVNDWQSLSKTEQLRCHSFLCDLTVHYVPASKASYIADLDSFLKSWEENLLGVLQTTGGAHWWEQCHFLFDRAVVEQLSARLARPDELPPAWTTMPWWQLE